MATIDHAPSEIADVVDFVANAIHEMFDSKRSVPAKIELRFRAVYDVIAEPFTKLGIEVCCNSSLSAVDALMEPIIADLVPGYPRGEAPFSRPGSWAAWGLSPEQSRRLFAAAAKLFRSDLWDGFQGMPVLKVKRTDGVEWLCRLVNTEAERGLTIGELPGVDAEIAAAATLEDALLAMQDRPAQTHLRFVPRATRPPSMLRESDEAGWVVAHPGAYPMLVPLHTPAGGITTKQAEDLIAITAGLPDFVDVHPVELTNREFRTEGVTWVHQDLGVTFQYHGDFGGLTEFIGEQFRDLLS